MKFKCYTYQLDVIRAGIKNLKEKGYYALFLEMGLGKTKCSIHIIEQLQPNSSIIICPKPLMYTWLSEIEKHSEKDFSIFFWENKKTIKFKNKLKKPYDIYIINVEAFSYENPYLDYLLKNNQKSLVIIDESTKIKTYNSLRTKKIIKSFITTPFKMVLTGTEITNSPLDLYSQFEFLKPNFWGMKNFYVFRANFAILKEISLGNRNFKKIIGFQKIEKLSAMVEPHCFRLKKKDCLDLPEKIYTKLYVQLNREQQKIYTELKNNLWSEYKNQEITVVNMAVLFGRFRQITGGLMPKSNILIGKNNPKLDALLDDCEDYNQKITIWCAFVAEIEYINSINKENSLCFYGKTTYDQRKFVLDNFEKNNNYKFLVANPQTAGFGLNLQFCSLVYWFSRTLSPEQNYQAEDRFHRIGQKNNVLYKDIIAFNTVDEKILKTLKNKKSMLEAFQNMDKNDFFDLI